MVYTGKESKIVWNLEEHYGGKEPGIGSPFHYELPMSLRVQMSSGKCVCGHDTDNHCDIRVDGDTRPYLYPCDVEGCDCTEFRARLSPTRGCDTCRYCTEVDLNNIVECSNGQGWIDGVLIKRGDCQHWAPRLVTGVDPGSEPPTMAQMVVHDDHVEIVQASQPNTVLRAWNDGPELGFGLVSEVDGAVRPARPGEKPIGKITGYMGVARNGYAVVELGDYPVMPPLSWEEWKGKAKAWLKDVFREWDDFFEFCTLPCAKCHHFQKIDAEPGTYYSEVWYCEHYAPMIRIEIGFVVASGHEGFMDNFDSNAKYRLKRHGCPHFLKDLSTDEDLRSFRIPLPTDQEFQDIPKELWL